jgi:hypothetical protein
MAIFTSVATVSYRYYDKRNRSVAEQNIQSMCRSLGIDVPYHSTLAGMPKAELIRLALSLHSQFPED